MLWTIPLIAQGSEIFIEWVCAGFRHTHQEAASGYHHHLWAAWAVFEYFLRECTLHRKA